MAGFVWLPQELTAHILAFLVNDVQSLKASSHVRRSFLHRTRVHLFRQFRINVTRSLSELREVFRQSPQIPDQVRVLTLYNVTSDRIRNSEHLAPVISSFSCLQDIRFTDVSWMFLPKDSRDALSSHAFESIAFRFVDMNTSDFYSLVSGSYDSLHRLKLDHLDQTRVRPGLLECSVGSSLRIRNLSLKPASLWNVLPPCLSLKHVHTLDVLFHDFDAARDLRKLLRSFVHFGIL